MGNSNERIQGWRFGEFVLDPAQRRLLRNGEPVHLDEHPFDLLVLLTSHWDRPLDRREIITALWGSRPVGDNTLRQVVYKARQAVGDDGDQQHVIRTLHGRSLQWVAPLEPIRAPPASTAAASNDGAKLAAVDRTSAGRRSRGRWPWAALIALIAIGVLVMFLPHARAPQGLPLPRVAIEPFVNATGDTTLDWIKDGLPGLLSTLVAKRGGVDVVNSVQVAKATGFTPQHGRTREQQLRFVTGAGVLVGGTLRKLTAKLYELNLQVKLADGRHSTIQIDGEQPGVLAVDAVARIRRALGLGPRPDVAPALAQQPFVAQAYARGMDLLARGKPIDARPYFSLCASKAPAFLPAQLSLAQTQYHSNDLQAASRTLQHLLTAARQRNDVEMIGRALLELGIQSRHAQNEATARKYLGQALGYLAQAGNVEGQISAYAFLVVSDAVSKRFARGQRTLAKAEALLAQRPDLRRAQGFVISARAHLALAQGDPAAALVAFKRGLALREAEGDAAAALFDTANIGAALLNAHFPLQAISMLVRTRQIARQTKSWAVLYGAQYNLFWALTFVGLVDHAVHVAANDLAMSKRRGNRLWQWEDGNLLAVAALVQGDYQAALKSLRAADALEKPGYRTSDFVYHSLYENLAAYRAEPTHLTNLRRTFDAFSAAHAKVPGATRCAHLLDALAASATGQRAQAIESLKRAAAEPQAVSDGDIELRMAPLLIAIADHSAVAAQIALQGYAPATTRNASLLPLYIEWATQTGDTQAAARASAHLAALRQQGRAALAAASMETQATPP